MRVGSLLLSLAAALPAAVTASGTLGFALGDKNPDGSCKEASDYEKDFDALKPLTNLVRIYSVSDCHSGENIVPAAKAKGFKVVMGVWPDTDAAFNADFGVLKKTIPGNEEVIQSITVGSECLYRGSLSAEKLLERINQVKKQFPTFTVGTADSWNKFADGTADQLIQGGVYYILANAFSYWQGTPVDNSTYTYFHDLSQALEHVQEIAGDNADQIQFVNGETGWPGDGGSDYGPANAGTANAAQYYQTAVCGMLTWDVDVFYFEAFDETWKPASTGDNGQAMNEQHWGMFTDNRKLKFDATCPKN